METFYLFCALTHLNKGAGELGIRSTESLGYPAPRAQLTGVCKSHSQESAAIFWRLRILHSCQELIYM